MTSFKRSVTRPVLVVLHDLEHGDTKPIREQIGVEPPFTTHSFTDLHPEENPHNEDLKSRVFNEGDFIAIQERLLDLGAEAARVAVLHSGFSSMVRSQYWLFDDDYNVAEIDYLDLAQRI